MMNLTIDIDRTSNLEQLKPVSTQKFRIKSLQKGMNQFYPIIFDEWHFAVVRFALHASLLDFSYKPPLYVLFYLFYILYYINLFYLFIFTAL